MSYFLQFYRWLKDRFNRDRFMRIAEQIGVFVVIGATAQVFFIEEAKAQGIVLPLALGCAILAFVVFSKER